MPLFQPAEGRHGEAIARLAYCNPFTPERIELEQLALGDQYHLRPQVWSMHPDDVSDEENLAPLGLKVATLTAAARGRFGDGYAANEEELLLYEDLALYELFDRHRTDFVALLGERRANRRVKCWPGFLALFEQLLHIPSQRLPTEYDPAHIFAGFFQVVRLFRHTFEYIIGSSMPAARLRAAVWESVFTHDLRRYRRSLYRQMGDVTSLITGPSGTGKELVARAIGLSRYIPFDAASGQFAKQFATSFLPVNLSALSPALIESELFGHRRGAFTGADSDREGWLEVCGPLGTVFLDEIGELDGAIQVKMLRVLQSRTFQRLGETTDKPFEGKIIAATNRDLSEEMRSGRFREDFYYRLCSDRIYTPSLREQLQDSPGDLYQLVLHIARRFSEEEAEPLAREATDWIDANLGRHYAWPGNVRELEQCFRNVVIRRHYSPGNEATPKSTDPRRQITTALLRGDYTADELLRQYCTLIYSEVGSYEESARRLGLDRRTVKAKLDENLLERLGLE